MLNLFILETCPYCHKVIEFMDEAKIDYNVFDVSNQENYEKLMSLGKKEQVPFLWDSDNDVIMYDSYNIVKYLENYKG